MASTSLGRLYVDLLMKTGSFETDAGRAAKIAEKRAREIDRAFAGAMSNVKSNIIGVGVALLGINSVVSLAQKGFAWLIASIDNADKVNELSTRLGISAEKISAWGYAAKQSGSDIDSLGAAIPKLSKNIAAAADASSSAGKLFADMGIDVKDGNKSLRDAEGVLPEIMDLFKSLKNDTLEQSLAMELFGKSGAQMLEFLNLGSDGLQTFEQRAAALGITISGETAAAADEFNDKLSELHAASEGFTAQLSAELLPELTRLVDWAVEFTADGSNAAMVADGISAAFTTMSNSATITADGLSLVSTAALDAISSMGGFLQSLVKTNEEIENGRQQAIASLEAIGNGSGISFGNVKSSSRSFTERDSQLSSARAALSRQAEDRLLRGLSGGGKKSGGGKPGKPALTEEQKRAEELQRAYESLNATMAERLAILREETITGEQVGEAWKVSYDIQSGALKGLDAAKAKELVANAEMIDSINDEIDVKKRLADLDKQKTERFEDTYKSLQDEFEAMGLSNEALRIRNELQRAGVELDSERGRAIAGMVKSIDAEAKKIEGLDAVRDVAHDFLIDLPSGAADAWKNALAQIESMLLQWAAKGLVDQLFGEQGTNGKGSAAGGWLGSLFSSFTDQGAKGSSGGGWMSAIASIFGGGRADGGPVMGGKLYEVNERGLPEIVTIRNKQLMMMPPGVNGHVTPMRAGGRQLHQVNNFNFAAPVDNRSQQQIAMAVATKTSHAVRRG